MGLGLHPIKAYASWDPYENLRIALGNWTPTPIFKIESPNLVGENYKYIKGDATQIFLELEGKKAELLLLKTQIEQLKDCKVQTCYKIVESTTGSTSNTKITIEEIEKALDKLNVEFTALEQFVDYAEEKLVKELPKIKLALEVEILGGKTELKDFRSNIKNMIKSGEVTPIGKASDHIEIKPPDYWTSSTFQFSGTAVEVKNRLKEAGLEVSKRYEELTGIKAIFSENGNGMSFDVSNSKEGKNTGINENTPQAEIDAYTAIKGMTVANALANEKIIEAALFKPVDQRSELEKNVIQTRLNELKISLYENIGTREANIEIGKQRLATNEAAWVQALADKTATLAQLERDFVAFSESCKTDCNLTNKGYEAAIEAQKQGIKQSENALVQAKRQAEGKNWGRPINESKDLDPNDDKSFFWFDGYAETIKEQVEELRKLAPETSVDIIKQINNAASKSVEASVAKHNYNTSLQDLTDAKNKLGAQLEEKFAAENNLARLTDYYAQEKEKYKADSEKYTQDQLRGVLEKIESAEKTEIEQATKYLDSINSSSRSTTEHIQALEKTVIANEEVMTKAMDVTKASDLTAEAEPTKDKAAKE